MYRALIRCVPAAPLLCRPLLCRAPPAGIKRGFPLSSAWSGAKFRTALVFHVPGRVLDAPAPPAATAAPGGDDGDSGLPFRGNGDVAASSGASPSAATVTTEWDAVVVFSESFRVMAKQSAEGLKLKQQHYPKYEQVRRGCDVSL
jgi:hypothetical protein